ncbi:MAG: asparaginase domain-containing protein [Ruminococcus sp.]
MKIKVIMTGGTVGSEEKDGVICNEKNKDVVALWQDKSNSNIAFTKVYPYSILSENICIENWEMLMQEISKDKAGYSGIIITHGSDTLSYTSAMVSIFCKEYKIPVVLTGANKILSDPESNGISNFEKAVEIVRENRTGVWTVFDGIYPANCIMEANCFTDKFSLGQCSDRYPKINSEIKFKNKVMIIKEYPFADYSTFDLSNEVKAVLLVGYHSGTANENSVKTLAEKCRNKGISLYLQGLSSKSGVYSSTDNLLKSGVTPLYDMTVEYAFAYLMFEVNRD